MYTSSRSVSGRPAVKVSRRQLGRCQGTDARQPPLLNPPDQTAETSRQKELREFLRQLTAARLKASEVVALADFYFHSTPSADIAEACGVNTRTMKRRLARGLARLKKAGFPMPARREKPKEITFAPAVMALLERAGGGTWKISRGRKNATLCRYC